MEKPKTTVCVDASLVVKLMVLEDRSQLAQSLWEQWVGLGEVIRAPSLVDYEVASVLRLHAYTGRLPQEESRQRLGDFLGLPIVKEHDAELVGRALEIAELLHVPRAYDAAYLALAERHGAPLWTADDRLWNAAHGWAPWLHRLAQ